MWLAMSILHTSAGLVDVAAGLTVWSPASWSGARLRLRYVGFVLIALFDGWRPHRVSLGAPVWIVILAAVVPIVVGPPWPSDAPAPRRRRGRSR